MEITSEELKQKLENGETLLVDFWAPWCEVQSIETNF